MWQVWTHEWKCRDFWDSSFWAECLQTPRALPRWRSLSSPPHHYLTLSACYFKTVTALATTPTPVLFQSWSDSDQNPPWDILVLVLVPTSTTTETSSVLVCFRFGEDCWRVNREECENFAKIRGSETGGMDYACACLSWTRRDFKLIKVSRLPWKWTLETEYWAYYINRGCFKRPVWKIPLFGLELSGISVCYYAWDVHTQNNIVVN